MAIGDIPIASDPKRMVSSSLIHFDVQVRKLATGYRLKRFKELLPGLDTDTLFTDYPKVLLMDLKKVSQLCQLWCEGTTFRHLVKFPVVNSAVRREFFFVYHVCMSYALCRVGGLAHRSVCRG